MTVRRHVGILIFLTVLFVPRVVGQWIVATWGVSWLPPMEEWYSGLIPYSVLLPIQIVILGVMIKAIADVRRGHGLLGGERPRMGRLLVGSSYVYAGLMVVRYIALMARHPENRWLAGTIPIWFHFVLAAFVYYWGRSLRR